VYNWCVFKVFVWTAWWWFLRNRNT